MLLSWRTAVKIPALFKEQAATYSVHSREADWTGAAVNQ